MRDLDLVISAINGNEKAFETLIKSENEKLYRTAFLYVRNKEDALDVLQETIYKAFVSIKKLKSPEYFSTWLTKILIHTAYDLIRNKKKDVLKNNINYAVPNRHDIDWKMDLTRAISMLKQDYQTVIILFYYHDLPIQCIAETMERPENTVKTYLSRAKVDLKRIIEGGNKYEQKAT